VVVVGSIASGLALKSSDCDMAVIALGRAPDDVLRQVHEEMDRRYRKMQKAFPV
jgi:predicted nucleotidyltransferase